MNQSDSQSFIDSLSSKFNNIVNEFDTLKINVESSQWTETVSILKNDFGLEIIDLCQRASVFLRLQRQITS